MDGDESRDRAGSTCSSQSRDSASSWTLLNAHGSDSEMQSTVAGKVSNSESMDFEAVRADIEEDDGGSIVSDSEDDEEIADLAQEADEDLDSTLSIEEAAKLRDEPLDVSDDEVDRVPSDEDVEEDDISIVDENEGLEEPSARMYVDTTQVTRLLDALAANQSTACYGDDLPVNFVQMCSNRIKNYIHQSNARLNSKLTILLTVVTAIVIGLGIGHFIGTTHTWLKRNQLVNDQMEQLRTLQDNLVSCIGKLEQSESMACRGRPDLLYQATSARNRVEDTCQAAENPTCQLNLAQCEQQLHDARSDFWRKSAVHRYIMHSASQQQQHFRRSNDSDHAAALLWRAKMRQRKAERQLAVVQFRLRHQTAELNLQRAMAQRLLSMETVIKQQTIQAQAEKAQTMQTLRESTDNVRYLQESLNSCRRELNSTAANNKQSASFDDVFDRMHTFNLSETLASYLKFARRVRLLPDWTKFGEENEQVVVEQLEEIRRVFDRLRLAARERMRDLQTLASAKDLTPYYDGARALTVQVGTALTRVWRETRVVAQTVVRDLSDERTRHQIVAIVQDLGRSAQRLQTEVEETLPAVIQDGWTAISARIQSTFDSILSPDSTEDEEAAAFVQTEMPTVQQTPRPTPDDQRVCDGLRQLARALDKADLDDIVGKRPARRFLDGRLNEFPCSLPSVAQLHFLACQKCWWMGNCVGLVDPSRCDWEDWQRSYRLDTQRLYRDHPQVHRILVDVLHWQSAGPSAGRYESPCPANNDRGYCEALVERPSADLDGRPPASSTDWLFGRDAVRRAEHLMEERAEWQFQRSAARDDQRRKLRSGYEQTDWLFRRSKERAEQRHAHGGKEADNGGWFDGLFKPKKHDRKDHKERRRQQQREKPRHHHHVRHNSMFGGAMFEF